MKRLLAALSAALVLAPVAARADEGVYRCAPDAMGNQVLTCVAAPELAAPSAEPAKPVERTLAGRTHNFLAPTGELPRAGDVELTFHQIVYTEIAMGLTDSIELNLTAPVIPAFASVGARVGLLPRTSPYRLVVGGSFWTPLMQEAEETMLSGTVTAAYQTDRLNVHASFSLFSPSRGDESLGVYNLGGSVKIGRKVALVAELVRLRLMDESGGDCAGDCGGGAAETIGASMVGVKLMGAHFDTDLGFMIPSFDDGDDVGAWPMVSMTYRY